MEATIINNGLAFKWVKGYKGNSGNEAFSFYEVWISFSCFVGYTQRTTILRKNDPNTINDKYNKWSKKDENP